MPESRHKYLYERLGDHDFQLLVGALLSEKFPGFVPLPLRQADGGRDGLQLDDRTLVYQVKWSVTGSDKDPVSWLDATVRNEADNLRRFAAAGVRRYVIVTNVPSTAKPDTGTFDRLDAKLLAHSRTFGIEMTPLWREAVDAMVDSAATETKWAYADMLAGWDLIRYLIAEQTEARHDTRTRDLLRRVAAVQWTGDARVKFSQVELDRALVSDLFVDVAAERVQLPARVRGLSRPDVSGLGGAAAYLTGQAPMPFTLVRGAPGQGKSTLSQVICQAFRAPFLPAGTTDNQQTVAEPRFPFRIDLGEYAAWTQGYDVLDQSEVAAPRKGRRRRAAEATLEHYLAEVISLTASGDPVTPNQVQDVFTRVPSLVVLDGLDEVASVAVRKQVVAEIDRFCSRSHAYVVPPRVVVTSRPNSAGLPEPDLDVFEVITLSPMGSALRAEYLRRWCAVHLVSGREGRTLRRNFTDKMREPYIGELAGNPMQLTILLYLLRQRGDATPNQRTELYDAYLQMLLTREANKHPESVRKHRDELVEIVPFLGWYLQSRAEEEGHGGRMSYGELVEAMKHYQRTYGKREDVVDELFEAASDRLWALTSKEQGIFEFEVLSLREYFAAQFLWRSAGEDDRHFDQTVVLRELLRRPYWLNTVRFYSGNATGHHIYALHAGILDELKQNLSKQVRVAVWNLLIDGVLNSRPLLAADVVAALTDDHSGELLLAALDAKEIPPLPEPSHAGPAFDQLTSAIAADPTSPGNHARVRVLRELLGLRHDVATWWAAQLRQALGTNREAAWLAVGATGEVAGGEQVDVPDLQAGDGERAQLILNTGLAPEDDSRLGQQLLRAVLDGQCSETTSARCEAARVAVALGPGQFIALAAPEGGEAIAGARRDLRSQAIQLLRTSGSPYAEIAALRRFRRGEKGTTFPFDNAATALTGHTGRCWLAVELGIIGAASSLRNGFTVQPGSEPFGPRGRPATLIAQTRAHRHDVPWWRTQLAGCHDDLSKAEWALAAWGVAEGPVLDTLLTDLDQVLHELPDRRRRPLRIAALRLGRAGLLAKRKVTAPAATTELLAELISARQPRTVDRPPPAASSGPIGKPLPALAAVARTGRWLQVDRAPRYR